jgi:hypothetical protein
MIFVVGVSCSVHGRTVYNVELLKQPHDCSGLQNHGNLNNFCFYWPNPVLEPRKKLLEYSERNCVYRNGGVYMLRNHKTFSINSGTCFRIFSIEFYSRPSYLLSLKHTALRCVASRQNDIAFASKMAYIFFGRNSFPPPRRPGLSHSRGFYITHNDAPQSVGLLWTSDKLVAETST